MASIDTLAGLVAQAEGAGTTEAERQAFLERAELLSAKLGIDLAVARAHKKSKEDREEPEEEEWEVGWSSVAWNPVRDDGGGNPDGVHRRGNRLNPYVTKLFMSIATVHDCKCTVSSDDVWVFTYGMPSDHNIIDNLYQLAWYAMYTKAEEAIRAGAHKEVSDWYSPTGHVSAWNWKKEFYNGFIGRMRYRLAEAKRRAAREADEQLTLDGEGGTGVEVVLREKEAEVDDFFRKSNPHLYPPDEEGNIPDERSSKAKYHKDKTADSQYIASASRAGAAAASSVDIGDDGTSVSGAAERKQIRSAT